ncbi:MAG: YbaB/EbfC family nucleoid-associated protein [Mycolicibacterium sp.]|uniref:YbaB/EbfC family nucleoid-associated protein n=1 Tax=Mycolicibacterium sp. TaxID=2320850 RepID=UPI003D14C317
MTRPAPEPTPQPTAQEAFDALDDRGKRDFVDKELGDVVAGLDELIKKLSNVKVGAEDPDGVVQVTLSYNGRLSRLWVDPAAPTRFSNLELEDKLNQTNRAALAEIDNAWAEETKDAINYLPPG